MSAPYGFCQSVFVVNSADVHSIAVSAELTIMQSTVSVDLHVLQTHNFCGPAICKPTVSANLHFVKAHSFWRSTLSANQQILGRIAETLPGFITN